MKTGLPAARTVDLARIAYETWREAQLGTHNLAGADFGPGGERWFRVECAPPIFDKLLSAERAAWIDAVEAVLREARLEELESARIEERFAAHMREAGA